MKLDDKRHAGDPKFSGIRFEPGNNVAAHFAERVKEWNKSYSDLLARNLGKLYIHGEMEINVGVLVGDRYLCAIIRADDRFEGLDSVKAPLSTKSSQLSCAPKSSESLMLGLPVEPVEGKEIIVPSLVRFEAKDRVLVCGGEPFDLFEGAFVGESRHILADGKINIVCSRGPVAFCERDSEVVERVPLGLNGSCDLGRDAAGNRLAKLHVNGVVAPIFLRLSRDLIWVGLHEGCDIMRNHVHLGIRPCERRVSVRERG